MIKKLNISLLVILLAVLFLFTLASCGSEGVPAPDESEDPSAIGAAMKAETPEEYAAKVVRDFTIDGETDDFDAAKATIEAKIKEMGGYMQNMNVSGGIRYSGKEEVKTGYFDIRIPATKVDDFISAMEKAIRITSTQESARDVSQNYYDTAARISALQSSRESLEEMLKDKSTNYPQYTSIRDELSKVISELDQLQSEMKNLENKVSFSTVRLSFEEVTVVTPEDAKFFVRLGTAFINGFSKFLLVAKELLSVFAWCLSFFGIPAVLTVGIIFLCKWSKKKKQARKLAIQPKTNI